ncbi:hypothetical protein [Rhizobium laguerreae]|uniref:hypothetical protein n=1 Tax=Rhizobium laguerreae TaxID=1076926 RepID=UPI0014423AA7|nr:hypothetical protein [Rhizobium laguerreae]MBY3278238.1 hypothetical protein [Rhizobium laguerreae]NKM38562.1 hypothetical protein [Rhizobium laguerreae]
MSVLDQAGGDVGRTEKLIEIGSSPDSIAKVQELAKKTMKSIGYVYPRKACAATLSHFLREAGINMPITTGAQNLADRLRINRHWERITVGKQLPGDVGVCYSMADDVPGADHVYLVIRCEGDDKMIIADNQLQGTTHSRYASGQGGKSPTEYFLRATATYIRTLADPIQDETVWPDESTNGLPELFMDDGSARSLD